MSISESFKIIKEFTTKLNKRREEFDQVLKPLKDLVSSTEAKGQELIKQLTEEWNFYNTETANINVQINSLESIAREIERIDVANESLLNDIKSIQ
jgi:ABC-type transporter Mla subunit MlaD